MNRDEVRRLFESIESNADVALTILLRDPSMSASALELELLTRCDYIVARVDAVRAEITRDPAPKLHAIGNRSDAA